MERDGGGGRIGDDGTVGEVEDVGVAMRWYW